MVSVRLTREEVPVAVGFILALLAVGHGGYLLGRGAAHLLLLSCSPPHPRALQAHLEGGVEKLSLCAHRPEQKAPPITDMPLDKCFVSGEII